MRNQRFQGDISTSNRESCIYRNKKVAQTFKVDDISSVIFNATYGDCKSWDAFYLIRFSILDKNNKTILKKYPISAPKF